MKLHTTFGCPETSHAMLRGVYSKGIGLAPQIAQDLLLFILVKMMNHTVRPDGLVSLFLIFGKLLKILQMVLPYFTDNTLLIVHAFAWAEFETAIAKKRIHTTSYWTPLPRARDPFISRKPIHVNREKEGMRTRSYVVGTGVNDIVSLTLKNVLEKKNYPVRHESRLAPSYLAASPALINLILIADVLARKPLPFRIKPSAHSFYVSNTR